MQNPQAFAPPALLLKGMRKDKYALTGGRDR